MILNITATILDIMYLVLDKGVLSRIGQESKNFAVKQNNIAQTLKVFILSITGNMDLSKKILHKQINFICHYATKDDEDPEIIDIKEGGIYKGKNYSLKLIKKLTERGLDLETPISFIEDRFLPDGEKDYLLMIVASLLNKQTSF